MAVVVGYPRSGNTWLQYCCSKVLGESVLKSHWYTDAVRAAPAWVFPVRNYKECILRHGQHGGVGPGAIGDVLLQQTRGTPCRAWGGATDYIDLLRCFDRHAGPKKLIYYEDLVGTPKETLAGLFLFLGKDGSGFLEDLDGHAEASLAAYAGGSATRGKKAVHHSLAVQPEARRHWDDVVRGRFPGLYDKYLLRYRDG